MTYKQLGQFFTINNELQQFVFDHVKNKGQTLLEPSFGAGHLLLKFLQFNPNYPMIVYEIDSSISPVVSLNENQNVIYGDFTSQKIDKKFKTIIGNPPYVKTKNSKNLYLKFIELSFNLLDDKGEIIFIVPSDFIKLTSASSIIKKMTEEGSFTHFYFPHDEKLFDNASIDVVVFRYEKLIFHNKSFVNDKEIFTKINNGIITFSETESTGSLFSELFDVYVGMVSGKDDVFKYPLGNFDVLTDHNKCEKFILIDKFPSENENINTQLLSSKNKLLERRIRKFNETNWYEWGAARNINNIKKHIDKPCIFVKTITRKNNIAFINKVQYFGGGLLCLIPKCNIDLQNVLNYLNSETFKKDYMYAGRFKIGHKQLCNASFQ